VLATRALAGESEVESAAERAGFANKVAADLVLSLTLRFDPDEGPGAATYFYGHSANGYSIPGQLAATIILDGICGRTDLDRRELRGRTWDMLRLTQMPTVRIECGNVAHQQDLRRLEDVTFIEALAFAIADSIEQFFAPEHII
jgi:N-acetylmuramoyl-L-alanine amidase